MCIRSKPDSSKKFTGFFYIFYGQVDPEFFCHDEIDQLAKKVASAGGTVFAPPGENQGWMYGFAFTDPDGHRWNALHIDMSKMPKG